VKSSPRNASGSRPFETYLALARRAGTREARIIPARSVVTAEWVRFKCQYGCDGYGKRLCCPPCTPTPEQTRRMIAGYRSALIYTYPAPSRDRSRAHRRMQKLVAGLERAMFLDGFYKAFGFCAGPCRLCPTCDPSGRCKLPDLARPAMEACGIDVYATCRNAGIELKVVTRLDAESKHVNLILID